MSGRPAGSALSAPEGSTTALRVRKAANEAVGLFCRPQRILPLASRVSSDAIRMRFHPRHLYSYTKSRHASAEILELVLDWILAAQRANDGGGIAAYYSLLTGYAPSYPEVTGYLVPTLYDCGAQLTNRQPVVAAERAIEWLLSLQMPNDAFPSGFYATQPEPSIFNTGQILQGLVRAYAETGEPEICDAAIRAGDWLIEMQQANGSWTGRGVYQNTAHTYYGMVAWAMALLSHHLGDRKYSRAAEKNLAWILPHFRSGGWVDGIHLQGHPNYLHFIAYALQGTLECAILTKRQDVVDAVTNSAWVLLRRFEANKFLCGAYDDDFRNGRRFACLTGNAQMSCVWLRLFEIAGDLRYLNAALKMNELLKDSIPLRGPQGIVGGVSGSYPIWGGYQPLRYISWGCKFAADALLLERRITAALDFSTSEALRCAS